MIRINRNFIIVFLIFFALLYGLSLLSFDMFYLVVSMATIFFGFLIYILVINSTISMKNSLLLTIATVYLFVGFLDFTYAISYEGLNYIFSSTNDSAQLWVASRFLEASGFLIALTICRKNEKCFSAFIQIFYAIVVIGSLYLINFVDLHTLYDINTGYTFAHYVAVSIIIFLFLLSIIRLFMIDAHLIGFGRTMMIVLLLKIGSEVIFGFFNDVSETLLVARYMIRLLSYAGLYMLVVKEVLQNPQQRIYDRFAKKQNELLRLSQIDQLTKIYNHKTSFSKIEEFLQTYQQQKLVYLAMIDIDDFKEVNDTYGHLFGDRVLERFSKILFRTDLGNIERVVGRYGGDEFIVAGTVNSKEEAVLGFERFSKRINQEFEDIGVPITCSVGITFSTPTDTVKDLVYKADIEMYKSKQQGKNQITTKDEQ